MVAGCEAAALWLVVRLQHGGWLKGCSMVAGCKAAACVAGCEAAASKILIFSPRSLPAN